MLTAITTTRHALCRFAIAGGLSVVACLAHAEGMDMKQILANRQVDEKQMEAARGGMEINGLNIDLGIQRTISINGSIQSINQFQWNSNQAAAATSTLTPLAVTNTLNNQMIALQTTINLQVTNLGIFRQMLSNTAITQALIHGIN
jgi:hypothetical protein